MAQVAFSYEIPFIDRVAMPRRGKWMWDRLGEPHPDFHVQYERGGPLLWDYDRHDRLGWMQFFYDWRFADLTGDGKLGVILLCGTFRQIAYAQDGTLLWRYEDPDGTLFDMRYDSNMPVKDLDGDGVAEPVCPRRIGGRVHLCIVNAATGELKQSIPFPEHDIPDDPRFGNLRGSVTVVNASGASEASDLLVYWDYRTVTLLDRDLNHRWTRRLEEMPDRKHLVFGHTPHAADLSGDGRDDILVSSVLFSADGEVMWVAPDLPALVTDGHADSVQIINFTGGDRPDVVMSTGAYCFSADGELQFGYDHLMHGQAQRVGKITDAVAGLQMAVYEGASRVDPALPDKVVALNNRGERIWEREIIQPDMQEGGFGFWLGDWNGDGLDEVFVNDPERCLVLNGAGELIDTIPNHLVYVFDLMGDSGAEAVTLTGIGPGMRLEIVTNDAPNDNPATRAFIERRKETPAMYNSTRY